MNRFKPDETMLRNYIQNKLSPQEEEQMELWLADHPDVLEDLELNLMIKEGVDEFNKTDISKQYNLHNTRIKKPNWNSKLLGVISLSIILGFFTFKLFDTGLIQNEIKSLTVYRIENSRSNKQNEIIIELDTNSIIFLIPMGLLASESYSVNLTNQSGNTFIEDDLHLQESGELAFLIPRANSFFGKNILVVKNDGNEIILEKNVKINDFAERIHE